MLLDGSHVLQFSVFHTAKFQLQLESVIFAGNLAFPLLLVGGLFLLSRRQGGGMSGPGGNNPLNFGKSKAKFQMEPNTGITFADVAGVEEAKQDFMEVSFCLLPPPPAASLLKEVSRCG